MFKKIIISGLIVATAFSSCKKDSSVTKAPKTTITSQMRTAEEIAALSDEDIFKAVMFLDGPAVDMIGDYKDLNIASLTNNQEKIAKVKQAQAGILSKVEADNPGFLSSFRTDITSGDYEKVKAAIFDAADLIFKATADINNVSEDEMTAYSTSIADEFMAKYNLSYNSSKSEFLTSVRAELQPGQTMDPCSTILVLLCGVVTGGPVIDNSISAFIVKSSYHGDFNSYESETFVSTIALSFGQN